MHPKVMQQVVAETEQPIGVHIKPKWVTATIKSLGKKSTFSQRMIILSKAMVWLSMHNTADKCLDDARAACHEFLNRLFDAELVDPQYTPHKRPGTPIAKHIQVEPGQIGTCLRSLPYANAYVQMSTLGEALLQLAIVKGAPMGCVEHARSMCHEFIDLIFDITEDEIGF